jgi:hypothetical protein
VAESCKDCGAVETFEIEGCDPCDVEPAGEFSLDGAELHLFDSYAQEHTGTASTPIDYYVQDVDGSPRDPLYDEPTERLWKGPYALKGYAEFPNLTAEAREEGLKKDWEATVWIARKEFEDKHAPYPKEGDVIRFWKIPFFDADANLHEKVPGGGWYFDVVLTDDDGHLFDGPEFVNFKLTVKRATEFAAERRVSPP